MDLVLTFDETTYFWERIWEEDLQLPVPVNPCIEAYSESGRYYHTLDHVRIVLYNCEQGGFQPALHLAGWFHDFVYDPTKKDNEYESALYARAFLTSKDVPTYVVTETMCLIMFTTGKRACTTVNEAILNDADLIGLSSDEDIYDTNSENIRKEYGMFSDEQWKMGRSVFLNSMLKKDKIYLLKYQDDLDGWAHYNMTRELENLNA